MKTILKLPFLLFSPILVVIYWRNAMKDISEMNASYDLNFVD